MNDYCKTQEILHEGKAYRYIKSVGLYGNLIFYVITFWTVALFEIMHENYQQLELLQMQNVHVNTTTIELWQSASVFSPLFVAVYRDCWYVKIFYIREILYTKFLGRYVTTALYSNLTAHLQVLLLISNESKVVPNNFLWNSWFWKFSTFCNLSYVRSLLFLLLQTSVL